MVRSYTFYMVPEKLRNMILYFVNNYPGIGRIHIQKALLLADRIYYMGYGESISGCEYVKRQYGPTLEKQGWDLLNTMIWTGDIEEAADYFPNGMEKIEHFARIKEDISIFNRDELHSLLRSLKIVQTHTAKKISDLTHDDAWNNTPEGEVIPYDSSIEWREVKSPSLSSEEYASIARSLESFIAVHP